MTHQSPELVRVRCLHPQHPDPAKSRRANRLNRRGAAWSVSSVQSRGGELV